MAEILVKKGKGSERTIYSFSGTIDEGTEFPQWKEENGLDIVFNLENVVSINSLGIKAWVEWVVPIAEKVAIEFINCPQTMVAQMNMIKNFLPESSKVSSFYIPLFCERCDREDKVLIDVTKEVEKKGEEVKINKDIAHSINCGDESCEMEYDVVEKKYFRFLENS